MKHNAFKLKIESPCQENWKKMHSNNSGKFCDACQKNVVDFTNKTPREISLALNNSSEKMCGRFTATQLEQVYSVIQAPKSETNWYHTIAASFLVMLGAKNLNAQESIPKNQISYIDRNEPMLIGDTIIMEQIVEQEQLTIKGKLTDAITGEPAMFQKVFLGNRLDVVVSDVDGNFELKFPSSFLKDSIYLTFGNDYEYEIQVQYYSKDAFDEKGALQMNATLTPIDVRLIDGMIIVEPERVKKSKRKKK